MKYLPNLIPTQTEKARESSLNALGDFDRASLKKAETEEKNSLPSTEAIAQELEHIKFKVRPSAPVLKLIKYEESVQFFSIHYRLQVFCWFKIKL